MGLCALILYVSIYIQDNLGLAPEGICTTKTKSSSMIFLMGFSIYARFTIRYLKNYIRPMKDNKNTSI